MKLLTLLLLLSCGQVVAQKKKEFQWPKPIKDSMWIEPQADTLFGTIEYPTGLGTVKGEGILVKTQFIHRSKLIYKIKDQQKIDSFLNTLPMYSESGGFSKSTEDRTIAYIKTYKGWKIVDEQFTFKPK